MRVFFSEKKPAQKLRYFVSNQLNLQITKSRFGKKKK